MKPARSAKVLASLTALLLLLTPALAKADDDGVGALVWFFHVLLAQTLATVVGLAILVVALVSRSRALWTLALVTCAANALMGIAVFLETAEQPSLFLSSAALQLVLGFIGCPVLLVSRRRSERTSEFMPSKLLTPRWLLLWILGHV